MNVSTSVPRALWVALLAGCGVLCSFTMLLPAAAGPSPGYTPPVIHPTPTSNPNDVPSLGMLLTFAQSIYDTQERVFTSMTAPSTAPWPPPGVDLVRVCGSENAFLSELPNPATVANQWAPVLPGQYPNRPTIDEPLFYATGKIAGWTSPQVNGVWSSHDIKFSHPFGRDYSFDIALSPLAWQN